MRSLRGLLAAGVFLSLLLLALFTSPCSTSKPR